MPPFAAASRTSACGVGGQLVPVDRLRRQGRVVGGVSWVGESESVLLDHAKVLTRGRSTRTGKLGNELLYRDREPTLEIVAIGRPWTFDGDGALFRLVSEARRIQLAHLFDPLLAVHTSLVKPLPHQIIAVYGAMLVRQPLRFLLADDPRAGRTIMAGRAR